MAHWWQVLRRPGRRSGRGLQTLVTEITRKKTLSVMHRFVTSWIRGVGGVQVHKISSWRFISPTAWTSGGGTCVTVDAALRTRCWLAAYQPCLPEELITFWKPQLPVVKWGTNPKDCLMIAPWMIGMVPTARAPRTLLLRRNSSSRPTLWCWQEIPARRRENLQGRNPSPIFHVRPSKVEDVEILFWHELLPEVGNVRC